MTTQNELRTAILDEVRCRTTQLLIGVLVEDYGRQVMEVIKQLARERKIRLVSTCYGIVRVAQDEQVDVNWLRRNSIQGLNGEWFCYVEKWNQ